MSMTIETLNELALILRGQHHGWEGDRIINGETFARRIGMNMPTAAGEIATEIEASTTQDGGVLCEITGLPPRSLLIFASQLRDATARWEAEIERRARSAAALDALIKGTARP